MSSAEELDALTRLYLKDGKVREAAESCDRMNQDFPEYEKGWYTASHLAMFIKQPILAVQAIDQALKLSPGKPEWLFQRVEALSAMGNADAAKETARQLADHAFDSAEMSAAFAQTASRLGMYALSKSHFIRAAELNPDEGQYYVRLATVERFLGNVEDANIAIGRALELTPDDGNAHVLRAGLMKQTAERNNIESLEAAYDRSANFQRRRIRICHALAKELDDMGEFERAFKYLSEGNTLRRSVMQYDLQNDLDVIENIKSTYSRELFDGHIEGHVNAEPIFVIGMPRTGSTLVGRILSSHSVVHGAGELQSFSTELERLCKDVEGPPATRAAELVFKSASVDFEALGENYIAATRPDTGKTAYFVDSLPLNFLYAGLIHLALPKAKIILLDRDPMDTCYSVYKSLFDGTYPYSYDMEETVRYYQAYRGLLNHWQSVMPDVIHIVSFEDLAIEPKPVIENLLSYCGLSYEEACLTFYESNQSPESSADSQVKGELFRSSIGKWRNYAEQLKPMTDILRE